VKHVPRCLCPLHTADSSGIAAVSPYSVSPLSNGHALTPPNESGRSAHVRSYPLSTAKPTIDLFPAFAVVMRSLGGTDGFSRPVRWLDRKLKQASRQEWADKVIRLRCVRAQGKEKRGEQRVRATPPSSMLRSFVAP
jgi:hypothetical protein